MSKAVKIILALSLALVLSLAAFGCGEGEITQEEIEQFVADTVAASAEVNTVKFDMDMQMAMDVDAQDESIQMTMIADGNGAVDNTDQEMQMIMNMSMDIPELGKQDMAMDMYATGGWMYMKMAMPGLDEQWMKMPFAEEIWQSQNQFAQQIELLRTVREVSFLGSENVNGTDCYVVEIVPDMAALFDIMSQQQIAGLEGIDLTEFGMADMIKEMSVKIWIAKDSYLEMKSDIHMLMEMTAADLGAAEDELDKATIDITMTMICYDYNQPVSIELPEEVQQAIEIPGF